MFYSQTFLARKGQLGTVWCAAHLQHRLKKSHYTSTNIPETVDLILFPEVPLALRMSGHLLLGVVRVYSKKVDYFFRDCILLRTWVTKAFVSTEVDLPENARQAPVESVTLPQALNLDEFELDEDAFEGEFDKHRLSEEDITLTDQIPTGIDPYVAITFDEDIMPEASPMEVDPLIARPGETDVEMDYGAGPNTELGDFNVARDTETFGPRIDTEEIPEFQDPRPSNITEPVSPGSVPEFEIRRDAAHDSGPASHPLFAEQNVRVEHTEYLDETLNEKETTIPGIDEEVLNSRRHSPFQLRSESPGLAGSEEQREHFVHPSPQLVLQPTPPPQQQTRPRKRKHFDKVTVLSNRIMRERLEDSSETLRKRKKLPSSKLGIWRLNNQSKKDDFFNEPLFTGFSGVLRSVFEKDCVASKPHLAVSDETTPEPARVLSPTREAETEISPTSPIPQFTVPASVNVESTVPPGDSQQTETVQEFAEPFATAERSTQPFNDDDIGIEHLREGGFSEYMSSPPRPRSSPSRTDDFTSQPGSSEMRSYRTEPSTSRSLEDLPGVSYSGLPAIPEMADEELSFLEVGGNTPVRSPASQDSDALTGRTRALAQYLKERSSSSPTSRDPSGELSLSKILEGKTRKIAARMFFETLVLKSRGLIDTKQDQPYSDISLKLKPALFSKVQE